MAFPTGRPFAGHLVAIAAPTAALMAVALAIAPPSPVRASDVSSGDGDAVATARRSGEGIWKAAVPPGRMRGEFEAHDPIGLAAGVRIKADCSINWVDPDTRKLYCFSSATSLNYFLSWPRTNIERARKGFTGTADVPTN